jgi:hypothetical protein
MDTIKIGKYEVLGTTYGHPDNHGKGLHTNGKPTYFYRENGSAWIKSEHNSLHKLRLELEKH